MNLHYYAISNSAWVANDGMWPENEVGIGDAEISFLVYSDCYDKISNAG